MCIRDSHKDEHPRVLVDFERTADLGAVVGDGRDDGGVQPDGHQPRAGDVYKRQGQYCREYLMQDPILTEALLTYLDDGHASDWLRSQKYTLDFIDYCLRLL